MTLSPKTRLLLVTATATAGAAAFWLSRTVRQAETPAPVAAVKTVRPKIAADRAAAAANSAAAEGAGRSHSTPEKAPASTNSFRTSIPLPAARSAAAAPTDAELHARAAKVEQEANHELERLVPLLNLSEDQQDRIFQRLAQNSPFWHPSLAVSGQTPSGSSKQISGGTEKSTPETGSTAPALPTVSGGNMKTAPVTDEGAVAVNPVDTILDELTPEQQAQLLQDDLDAREWWAEALTGIQEMMDGSSAGTAAEPVPPDKTIDGSATIQD